MFDSLFGLAVIIVLLVYLSRQQKRLTLVEREVARLKAEGRKRDETDILTV